MKTNDKGQVIVYAVTDTGIRIVLESEAHLMDPEIPKYDNFEQAAICAIDSLSDRVEVLEKKRSK